MKQTQLLFCSALLVAPISGLIASDAPCAPEPPPVMVKVQLEENPFENLTIERAANPLAKKISARTKAQYLASNPLADASSFKPQPEQMIARLKESVEAGVSEEKQDIVKPIAASEPKGKTGIALRIAPSNT